MSESTKAAPRKQTPFVWNVAVAICRWLVASLRRPNAGETEDNEERVFDMRKR